MWRRLTGRAEPQAAAASGKLLSAEEEATASLQRLAAEVLGGSPVSATDGDDKESALVQSIRLVLAVSPGTSRDELVMQLKELIEKSLLPGMETESCWLEQVLSLLRSCSDSKAAKDAAAVILSASERDVILGEHRMHLSSVEKACSGTSAGAEGTAAVKLAQLAAGLQSLDSCEQRCKELLHVRGSLLQLSATGLEAPTQEAKRLAEEAAVQQSELADKLASTGPSSEADDAGIALEREVRRLEELKKELRSELENVSRGYDEAIARQKAHMSQVDCWRLDKDKVKKTVAQSKKETEQSLQSAQTQQESCTVFVQGLKDVHASVGSESELESLAECCKQDTASTASLILNSTEERLQAARERARRAREEHRSALQTLELLEVRGTQNELPTQKDLADALSVLRDAWAANTTLGSIDLKRRAEVETFLREAAEEAPLPGESLAEAKASWAQRWAELGDLGQALASLQDADAAAQGPLLATAPEPPAGSTAKGNVLPSLDDEDAPLA